MRNEGGQFIKGNIPWSKENKGKYSLVFSDPINRNQRISEAQLKIHRGRSFQERQTINSAISRILTGRKLSEEHKNKLRQLTGIKNASWKGGKPRCPKCGIEIWYDSKTCKKHMPSPSEETRKKIGKAHIGRKNKLPFSEETRKKMSIAHRGERHVNWKGGVTALVKQIRNLFEYREWRRMIFERDNYTCVLCGNPKSGELNVDHYPKSFAQIRNENNITSLDDALACQELWDINNGRTLCLDCHKKTENYLIKSPYRRMNMIKI